MGEYQTPITHEQIPELYEAEASNTRSRHGLCMTYGADTIATGTCIEIDEGASTAITTVGRGSNDGVELATRDCVITTILSP